MSVTVILSPPDPFVSLMTVIMMTISHSFEGIVLSIVFISFLTTKTGTRRQRLACHVLQTSLLTTSCPRCWFDTFVLCTIKLWKLLLYWSAILYSLLRNFEPVFSKDCDWSCITEAVTTVELVAHCLPSHVERRDLVVHKWDVNDSCDESSDLDYDNHDQYFLKKASISTKISITKFREGSKTRD